jgi:hypothetical protein
VTETSPRRVTAEPVLVAGFVLLGVLAGVTAKAADESGWGWAADLGSYPAAWVLAVALIGGSAPSVRAGGAVRDVGDHPRARARPAVPGAGPVAVPPLVTGRAVRSVNPG